MSTTRMDVSCPTRFSPCGGRRATQIGGAERTATNQAGHTYIYELPFRLLDRETDMRTAYAEFERRLAAL